MGSHVVQQCILIRTENEEVPMFMELSSWHDHHLLYIEQRHVAADTNMHLAKRLMPASSRRLLSFTPTTVINVIAAVIVATMSSLYSARIQPNVLLCLPLDHRPSIVPGGCECIYLAIGHFVSFWSKFFTNQNGKLQSVYKSHSWEKVNGYR